MTLAEAHQLGRHTEPDDACEWCADVARLAKLEREAEEDADAIIELERERDELKQQFAKMTEWRDRADRQRDKERDRANTAETERDVAVADLKKFSDDTFAKVDAAQATAAMLREACEHARNYAAVLTGRPVVIKGQPQAVVTMTPWDFFDATTAALSTPGSDWLAERDAKVVAETEAHYAALLSGEPCDAGPVIARAIASRLASERRAVLEEAATVCVAEARAYEESAKACDASGNHMGGSLDSSGSLACGRCATNIRALATEPRATEAERCDARSPSDLPCVLPKGHDGVHVARVTWSRAPEAKPVKKPPCTTCGGSGTLMDSGPPDHWSAPCPDCAKEPR